MIAVLSAGALAPAFFCPLTAPNPSLTPVWSEGCCDSSVQSKMAGLIRPIL